MYKAAKAARRAEFRKYRVIDQIMNTSAKAYKKVARQIANPREMEADLLLVAASRLQAIQDDWESNKHHFSAALLNNRKLWTIFLTDVTSENSRLPIEIRQNVTNLGVFVINHTLAISRQPYPDQLSVLININRQIAAGLQGRP
jgi:flagellar biosynthesis activator protein FlaF